MIDYATFLRLRHLFDREKWTRRQIARELRLNIKTVRLWADRTQFQPRRPPPRTSKLDAFKADIVRLVHQHPFTAAQIGAQLRERGYTGGQTILRAFVQKVRPRQAPAFLTLHFEPGECAQVDWGSAGSVPVGSTRRRLSFFVMVLGYSRQLYVEFTLSETLEQFLACHQNAFTYFGGTPRYVMIDNLKTAVLSHPAGGPVVFNPRYVDFARHYGFAVRACNVRAAHEKGRVERAVGYVRQSFLNGLEPAGFAPLNPMVRRWLEEVAGERVHRETRRKPRELFAEEKPRLQPLPATLYDVGQTRVVHATRRCRVSVDGNRYSVPSEYAGSRLVLRLYPDKVLLYQQERLVAEHLRLYDRGRDLENPDHVRALLQQRRRAREQHLFQRFLQLSPQAELYYRQLGERRFNPQQHLARIVALSEIYGADAVARAMADAIVYEAFSAEYIANLLEARQRQLPEPGALHLTRRQDLLDLELPVADLGLYEANPENADENP